ncbi:mycothiol transferase [Cumulibacter manganitolerans]|uniref:mycothiol transferase n=1 Tax=Cumulibacter manganitolerans TaxID=1884992 RepID=UPI001E299111|nr:DUF664 domain-containing protein [Cumulibacter manganitolerans]
MGNEHFDEHASTWDDDPAKVERAAAVATGVARAIPATAGARLLEYGAGTGLVSQALVDRFSAITLADSSSGMRAVIGQKVAAGALPAGTRVWDLDLERQPPPTERFDVIVSSMVLHHVHDLERVLAGFAALLEDGGYLAIADLDKEDGSFHAHVPGFDGHSGFDRADLASRLERAGFGDVRVEDCTRIEKSGGGYPVFLATARRSTPPLPAPDDLKGWLLRYLQQGREAMLWKLEGLSEYDVRRPLTPTGTNLLGLVKHLASIELGYLGDTFDRPSGIPLPWFEDGAEDNADMWATPEESRADIVGLYRRAWAHADATVAALELDARGRVAHWPDERAEVTLGRILTHLATETHRHAGHADVVRELIDGAAGLRPDALNTPDLDADAWAAYRARLEAAARAADVPPM